MSIHRDRVLRSVSGQPHTRLVIAKRLARRDHLHGAWWPYSTDIERELSPMLTTAVTRLPDVRGVALNRDEWPGAPLVLYHQSAAKPKISWYGLTEPHMAVLHCGGHNRLSLALLLLPPDTPEDVALTAMLMAAAPGNCLTTTETLNGAREHTRTPIEHSSVPLLSRPSVDYRFGKEPR